MLIHNKRLHPRRPGERDDHYNSCMLHENYTRRSISPIHQSYSSSRYSSMGSLFLTPRETRASSVSSYLPASSTPLSAINKSRNELNASSINAQVLSTKAKSQSSVCLNASSSTPSADKPNGLSVKFKNYDSPDEIIANLFPGINEKHTTYLRKGHGAAQKSKLRAAEKLTENYRSASALVNYGIETPTASCRSPLPLPMRTCSTSSEDSEKIMRQRKISSNSSRLSSVDRDFENIRSAKASQHDLPNDSISFRFFICFRFFIHSYQ